MKLYFAYGSNMSTPRLRARVASAEPLGVARLDGHRLMFHKVGMDGSGKCDAWHTGSEDDVVLGVVFRMDAADQALLDRAEGLGRGYRRARLCVRMTGGRAADVFAYLATHTDPTLAPFDWYRAHVLAGAREHGLPADYVARIQAVRARPDPDAARRRRELGIHAGGCA